MKSFRNFIKEQKLTGDETTLDPDFVEKQERRKRQTEQRIEKPTQEINRKADQSLHHDMEEEI
jgi:hypothetical protein